MFRCFRPGDLYEVQTGTFKGLVIALVSPNTASSLRGAWICMVVRGPKEATDLKPVGSKYRAVLDHFRTYKYVDQWGDPAQVPRRGPCRGCEECRPHMEKYGAPVGHLYFGVGFTNFVPCTGTQSTQEGDR